MNEETQEFLIIGENGKEQKCRVVFTFDAEEKSSTKMVMKFLVTFLL